MRVQRVIATLMSGAALLGAVGVAGSLGHSTIPSAGDARNPYFAGYFTQTDTLDLGYRSVEAGRYHLEYAMAVQARSESTGISLNCNFADPNGIVGYLQGSVRTITADGSPQVMIFEGDFEVPEVTVALRCSPTAAGKLEVKFGNISLTAEPLPAR